jgi:hypothetical protein
MDLNHCEECRHLDDLLYYCFFHESEIMYIGDCYEFDNEPIYDCPIHGTAHGGIDECPLC